MRLSYLVLQPIVPAVAEVRLSPLVLQPVVPALAEMRLSPLVLQLALPAVAVRWNSFPWYCSLMCQPLMLVVYGAHGTGNFHRKRECLEKDLLECHFFRRQSHAKCFMIWLGPHHSDVLRLIAKSDVRDSCNFTCVMWPWNVAFLQQQPQGRRPINAAVNAHSCKYFYIRHILKFWL